MESLRAGVFKSMSNLRVLNCEGKFTSCEPAFLPDGLRWLCWREYPFSSLPVALMSKLVGLEIMNGRIEHLWKAGEKIMLQNLKFIDLGGCDSLKRFPDVSGAPNTESLNLGYCKNMVEVDESVGSLKKLLHLNMSGCYQLKCLPSMFEMESLETLILSFCHSLKRIPEFSPCMVSLSKLDISDCSEIEEVPSSIKYLSKLTYLKLDGCSSLEKLPDDFQSMESLEELHIDSIHIHASTNSCYLRKLYLHGHNDFHINPHGLSSLEELHICYNSKLIQLPKSISHLSSLKHLLIEWCSGLQTLGGLPPGIQVLTVRNCESLEKIEDLSKEYKCLNKIDISYCPKLLEDEENGRYLDKMLDQSFLKLGKRETSQHDGMFLDELREGSAGPMRVMVCRKWDVCMNEKYMSTDFIISDEKGNLMHCMSRHNKSYKFVDRLQEGRLYTLTGCKVLLNRKDFRILKDSTFMIELDGSTSVKNATGDVGGFMRYPFQIVSFEELVPTENKYLVDLIGYVKCVGDPIKKSNGAETVEFNLTNERGRQIRVTLWGSLGEDMIKKKAENLGAYSLILTSMSAKNFLGELGVFSSPSTQLIDNEDITALKDFKSALSPKVSTLEELLEWGRTKKGGFNKKQGTIVFRNTVEIVDIRTRNGWYFPTCPSGCCRKGLTRVKGSFWCVGCKSSVLHPRPRYKIQMEVRDESAETVVVLFDESAEKLLGMTAKSLMEEEQQEDTGDDVMPPVLRNMIGSQHIFEIKGDTYYRCRDYESFNCSRVILPEVEDHDLKVRTSQGSQ